MNVPIPAEAIPHSSYAPPSDMTSAGTSGALFMQMPTLTTASASTVTVDELTQDPFTDPPPDDPPPAPDTSGSSPGWKTTEMYITVLVLLTGFALVLADKLPADTFWTFAAPLSGAYAVARGVAKFGNAH